MKAGRMKNHVRSYHVCSATLISCTLHARCAMENLQFISKHPVAMNSVFLGTFPPPTCSVINSRCSAHILFTNQVYALFVIFSRKPRLIKFSTLGLFQIHRAQDKYGCTMETSQNIRKGMRSGRSTRPEPQSDWDSFSLTTGIPKDPKGVFLFPRKR
jgi:hypothetical protein